MKQEDLIVRVRVTLGKKESVALLPDGRLEVRADAKKEKGRANQRVVELLSGHFSVSPERIVLLTGHKQSSKTFRIHK